MDILSHNMKKQQFIKPNNFQFSLPMTTALAIAGVCLCCVSVYYTIGLLSSLGTDNHEKWLMTITAIGFEACKFAFVPLGFAMYGYGKSIKGSSILLLGVALVSVSIVASLGFLAAKTDQGIEQAKIESDEYQAYQARLETIDSSISMLSAAASIDASSQWRKARENAASKVSQINDLEQERSRTITAMNSIDATAQTETGALFTALGKGWNMSADQVKKACYIVVAALLELCSLAALSLAGVAAIKITTPSSPNKKEVLSSKNASLPPASLTNKKKSTSLFTNASRNNSSASVEAPVASTEALALSRSALEKQSKPKAFFNENASENQLKPKSMQMHKQESTASIHDLQAFSKERKRVEEGIKLAKKEKIEALKAHSAITKEAQDLSAQAKKLREEISHQTIALKKASLNKINFNKPKKNKKRITPPSSKNAIDKDLYVRICHEVGSGQTKQSIRAIQSAYNIGFKKAKEHYQKMISDGVITLKQTSQA